MARRLQNSYLLAAALLWTACRSVAPPPSVPLPDPLAPPVGGDPLTAHQAKAAAGAWAAAGHGDMVGVAKQIANLPPGHPVGELIVLETRFAKGEPIGAAAADLAARNPGYAAVWTLTALATAREGRNDDALVAARRALALRADDPNRRRVAQLEVEVVASGLNEAGALLARGDAAAAFARAGRLLELVPDADDARIFAARAALAAGRTAQAAELIPALPDTPRGLEVKGRVAEALGQWDLALDFYGRLPAAFPGRCELLAGAREQSRLSLAPPQLTRALADSAVTRRELAAILVWEVPSLTAKTTGPVPVFEDVVGLPEGRDVVVAVRAGVMTGDAIARRFGPNRPVTERDLEACLQRLAQAIGKAAPRFCSETDAADECLTRPATLDGRTVAALVRSVAAQEENPCSRR